MKDQEECLSIGCTWMQMKDLKENLLIGPWRSSRFKSLFWWPLWGSDKVGYWGSFSLKMSFTLLPCLTHTWPSSGDWLMWLRNLSPAEVFTSSNCMTLTWFLSNSRICSWPFNASLESKTAATPRNALRLKSTPQATLCHGANFNKLDHYLSSRLPGCRERCRAVVRRQASQNSRNHLE